MWFKPFMQSYLVVFIGYLTMYLIRKNFNIAQNDMISTYGLSMTQLGMIGLGFSITYGVGKTLVSYYADGKNTKQFLPFMLILSAICMLGLAPAWAQARSVPDDRLLRPERFLPEYRRVVQLFHHHQMDAAPQAWFVSRHVEHLPQPRRARQAWRCSVPTICSTAT
jgi:OPA family hexose phosphate transport protein UhpT-like MFS transporter